MEPRELRRILVRVAGEAAAFLRDKLGSLDYLRVMTATHRDETLDIDYATEDYIIELLRQEGVEGLVVTEERGVTRLGSSEEQAILIDPLDGSKNFAAFIPWSAVSIAAVKPREGRIATLDDIVAGVVAPVHNWPPLSFSRGEGVYEGASKPLNTPIRRILLYYAENAEQARIVEKVIQGFRERGVRVSARSLGAAALEVSWAGLGRALAFVDFRGKLRNIDVAAALGIAREAGATILLGREYFRVDRVDEVGWVVVAPPETSEIVLDVLRREGILQKRAVAQG